MSGNADLENITLNCLRKFERHKYITVRAEQNVLPLHTFVALPWK